MNIVRNEKMIKRNSRIAQIALLGGLAVLAGGMFLSFRNPEQYLFSLSALMVGFLLSQVGIYFQNRWGRRPRPDELLDQALKGMDKKYTFYHFSSPVSHLLVGPAGIWILLPYHQRGQITYYNKRWRQKTTNPLLIYLKVFAQEGLGRPDIEVSGEIERIRNYLDKNLPMGEEVPDIKVALVFTHPQVEINISEDESPPAETIPIGKLKDLIRKTAKSKSLSLEKAKSIQDLLSPNS